MNRPFMKIVFVIFYIANLATVVLAICWAVSTEFPRLYILTLSCTIGSIIMCVGWRIAYRKIILSKLELEQRAIRK